MTVTVAVHTAAPLGKTEPGQVFRKKVRADGDRRKAKNSNGSHIDDDFLQQAVGRRSDRDMTGQRVTTPFVLRTSWPHGQLELSGASSVQCTHACEACVVVGSYVMKDSRGRS